MEFSLYLDFVKIKFRSLAEYPSAFILTSISKILGFGSSACAVYLTIYRFGNVLGWTAMEVLLLFAFNTIAYGLAGFFMYHPFTKLQARIRDGTFDEMLTKPLNPMFYLCSREFSTGYFGNVAIGLAVLIISIVNLEISINPLSFLYLILALLGGSMIHSSFFIFSNVPCFWLVKADALGGFRHMLDNFIRFPISIYDSWAAVMLTFVFPFAFINFYPAQYFLNKSEMFSPYFAFFTPVIGFVLMLLGYAFFNLGIKHYNSSGS